MTLEKLRHILEMYPNHTEVLVCGLFSEGPLEGQVWVDTPSSADEIYEYQTSTGDAPPTIIFGGFNVNAEAQEVAGE